MIPPEPSPSQRFDKSSGIFAIPFFLLWFIAASSIGSVVKGFTWQHAYITYYYGVVPIVMSVSTPYWIRFVTKEPKGYFTIASPLCILTMGIGQLLFLPAFYYFSIRYGHGLTLDAGQNVFPIVSAFVTPAVLTDPVQLALVSLWIIGMAIIAGSVLYQAMQYAAFRRAQIRSTLTQPLLKVLEATCYFSTLAIVIEICSILVSAFIAPMHFYVAVAVLLNFGAIFLPQLAGSLLISPMYLSRDKSLQILNRAAKWLPLITWGIVLFTVIQLSFAQQLATVHHVATRVMLFGAPIGLLAFAITMLVLPTFVGIQLRAVDVHTCLMLMFLLLGVVASWLFFYAVLVADFSMLKLSLSLLMFTFKTGLVSLLLFVFNCLRTCGPRPSFFIVIPQFVLYLVVTTNSFLHLHGITVFPPVIRELSGILLVIVLVAPIIVGYPKVKPGELSLERTIQSVMLNYLEDELKAHDEYEQTKLARYLQSHAVDTHAPLTPMEP